MVPLHPAAPPQVRGGGGLAHRAAGGQGGRDDVSWGGRWRWGGDGAATGAGVQCSASWCLAAPFALIVKTYICGSAAPLLHGATLHTV